MLQITHIRLKVYLTKAYYCKSNNLLQVKHPLPHCMKHISYALVCFFLIITSCTSKQKADLLIYNATIYLVDSAFATTEAMAIKDGKIIATGKLSDIEDKIEATEKMDAHGKFIYPGFIDAHAHFAGYGSVLQTADLVGTES